MSIDNLKQIFIFIGWVLVITLFAWIAGVFDSLTALALGLPVMAFICGVTSAISYERYQPLYKNNDREIFGKKMFSYINCFFGIFFFTWFASGIYANEIQCNLAKTIHFKYFFAVIMPALFGVYLRYYRYPLEQKEKGD